MEFERWRGVGYHSTSRRACEAGFSEVQKGEMHVSVHRTEHRINVLSDGVLSGARVLSGAVDASWDRGERGTGQTREECTGHAR